MALAISGYYMDIHGCILEVTVLCSYKYLGKKTISWDHNLKEERDDRSKQIFVWQVAHDTEDHERTAQTDRYNVGVVFFLRHKNYFELCLPAYQTMYK